MTRSQRSRLNKSYANNKALEIKPFQIAIV